jgi:hypothetical protein
MHPADLHEAYAVLMLGLSPKFVALLRKSVDEARAANAIFFNFELLFSTNADVSTLCSAELRGLGLSPRSRTANPNISTIPLYGGLIDRSDSRTNAT